MLLFKYFICEISRVQTALQCRCFTLFQLFYSFDKLFGVCILCMYIRECNECEHICHSTVYITCDNQIVRICIVIT
jgi:hypothetical protein